MSDLKTKIIDAHGGSERWKQFRQLRAHLKQGGALWGMKGQPGVLDDTWVTVSLEDEFASHEPFGAEGRYSAVEAENVCIFGGDGSIEQDLVDPRASFVHHTLETPWSEAQLAYFAGIAMWTYLNVPFVLDWKGVETQEAGSWIENGEIWHRLTVRFPPSIPTHCSVQTLYADDQGLLKRHDYDLEIAGNTPAAHYIMGYIEVGGLWFPTRRRIFARQPDGTPLVHPMVVAIDIDSIELS